jgi:hypothetical protein
MKALLLLVLGVTTLAAEGAPITTADISYCKSFLMMAEQDETTSGLEMNAGIGVSSEEKDLQKYESLANVLVDRQ